MGIVYLQELAKPSRNDLLCYRVACGRIQLTVSLPQPCTPLTTRHRHESRTRNDSCKASARQHDSSRCRLAASMQLETPSNCSSASTSVFGSDPLKRTDDLGKYRRARASSSSHTCPVVMCYGRHSRPRQTFAAIPKSADNESGVPACRKRSMNSALEKLRARRPT